MYNGDTQLDVSYQYSQGQGVLTFNIPDDISMYVIESLNVFPTGGSNNSGGFWGTGLSENKYINLTDGEWARIVVDNVQTLRSIVYTIEALSEGRKFYAWYGYVKYEIESPSENKYVPYVTIRYTSPSISNLSVQGTSIDSAITCSMTLEDATSWKIECIKDGIVYKTYEGAAHTHIINPGELKYPGEWTFRLTAYNNATTVTSETTAILTRIEPVITSLEPDNVNQNINKQITVSWASTNQQMYSLLLDGKTYTGTTATSIVLPANTLTAGTKTITLTITFTSSWGEVRTTSRTVSFLAYGNPVKPVLDGTTVYNNALPSFTWTSSEQVAYELKVRNSSNIDIVATGEVISTSKSYTCVIALENNSTYTVHVRVKNQYNLWSEWASKTITTSFVVPKTPTISLVITDTPSVIVNFNIEYTSTFLKAEIWRKTGNSGTWIRIAYNLDNTFSYEDRFIGAETYYYKVRAIGTTGGIADSEISSVTGSDLKVRNFHLTNVEDFTQEIELIYEPKVSLNNNRKIVATKFAGCLAPKAEKGETKYRTAQLSFLVDDEMYNKLMNIVDNAQVLLYRDGRGRKFYCQVTSYPTQVDADFGYYTTSFTITEVAFAEGDFYSGSGNQPSLFFDGTWYFDGTKVLSGEDN